MRQFSIIPLKRNHSKQYQMKRWMRTIGLALILSTLSLNVSALNTEAQTRSASVQSGYSLLERGWVNDAIEAFRQALRNDPSSLEARLGLAIAYQRAGQDAEAWQAYQQVIAQDSDNITALTAIGELGGYRPEWQQQGIAALSKLLALRPSDLAARSQRALLYGYQGLLIEAIADYEQVLSTNPSPALVLEAAQIYTYSGDFVAGLSLFEQYLRTNQTIPDQGLIAYTQVLREANQASAAVEILTMRLRSLSDTDPVSFELRSALALAYQADQQSEQALASLDALRNQPTAQLPLARALSAIGRQTQDQALYAEAADLYQQVLRQTPTPTPGFLIEIADVLSEVRSSRAEARQLYQQVLEQQPNQPDLLLKLAWLNYQLGDLSQREFQQQAQQITQPLPTAAAEQQQLAQALSQINPPDPVLLTAYQQLLQSRVSVPFLQFRIAQIQLQQGNPAAARTALSAYQRTPTGATDPATELLLAEIERQEGDLTASAQRYEQIAARYANRPAEKAALRGLAGIRLAQGQTTAALRLYEQLQVAYPNDADLRLGYAAIAYRQQQLSEEAAEQVLAEWLRVNAAGTLLSLPPELPPELFLLVGTLPPDPKRESLYDELLAVEPNHIAVNRRWAQLWAKRDPDRARARIAQLLNNNPNSIDAYLVQGEFAQAMGELALASQSYEAILAQQPDQPDALIALAGVRFQQRRYAEAEQLYRQVIAQRGEDGELRRVLADLSIAQDQPVSALQELRQLQPDVNHQINARIHRLQIEFLRRRGFQPDWERY
jgi:tetratricopeptide (TPR) repeat protein